MRKNRQTFFLRQRRVGVTGDEDATIVRTCQTDLRIADDDQLCRADDAPVERAAHHELETVLFHEIADFVWGWHRSRTFLFLHFGREFVLPLWIKLVPDQLLGAGVNILALFGSTLVNGVLTDGHGINHSRSGERGGELKTDSEESVQQFRGFVLGLSAPRPIRN